MSDVLSLDKEMTELSLLGRRVLRIRCCGETLEQKAVFSILPTEEVDVTRSLIVLHCSVCHRELDVEFFTGKRRLKDIYKVLSDF